MDYPIYPIDDRLILTEKLPADKVRIWKADLDRKKLGYYAEGSMSHPAKMHVKMCRFILDKFTKKSDLILDPMSGISTTILEASLLGRDAIGVEYEDKFVKLSNESTNLLNNKPNVLMCAYRGTIAVVQGDARALTGILAGEVDGIVCSPPYCGTQPVHDQGVTLQSTKTNPTPRKISDQNYGVDAIVMSPPFSKSPRAGNKDKAKFLSKLDENHSRKFYKGTGRLLKSMHCSDDKKNISNLPHGTFGDMNKPTYLGEMRKVYSQCHAVLKEGGCAVLVTKNFTRNWKMVRLDMDTIMLMESCGFKLVDRYFRKLIKKSFWIWNYEKQFSKKFPGRTLPTAQFEDILVFRKCSE